MRLVETMFTHYKRVVYDIREEKNDYVIGHAALKAKQSEFYDPDKWLIREDLIWRKSTRFEHKMLDDLLKELHSLKTS